ncbi:MAG: hypothetical protein H7099_11210 [Gemmatimonadaceae bacterium]|nr:hypothetical protein [Gemmatimonadaceae bacterium]
MLLGLGALHGVNPGMGWLFAVALGLQQGERRAVWRALPPLAAGHAMAITVAVAVAIGLGRVLPATAMRWGVVVALAGLGVWQLCRHRHPRYGGMRVGARELTTWSFLVATAHGAGLMAAPFALQAQCGANAIHCDSSHAAHHGAVAAVTAPALAATAVHTVGYLIVTVLLALVVHRHASGGAGLSVLRRAWVNLDMMWAVALVLTAAAVAVA